MNLDVKHPIQKARHKVRGISYEVASILAGVSGLTVSQQIERIQKAQRKYAEGAVALAEALVVLADRQAAAPAPVEPELTPMEKRAKIKADFAALVDAQDLDAAADLGAGE